MVHSDVLLELAFDIFMMILYVCVYVGVSFLFLVFRESVFGIFYNEYNRKYNRKSSISVLVLIELKFGKDVIGHSHKNWIKFQTNKQTNLVSKAFCDYLYRAVWQRITDKYHLNLIKPIWLKNNVSRFKAEGAEFIQTDFTMWEIYLNAKQFIKCLKSTMESQQFFYLFYQ